MENFIINPGLQHLAETIFLNVEVKNLFICENINWASKKILENPNFWLKKWRARGLSKKNHEDWKKAIQLTQNTPFEANIKLYMRKVMKKKAGIDITCYVDKNSIKLINLIKSHGINEIYEFVTPYFDRFNKKALGICQILAPMIQNPNRKTFGKTLIYEAVEVKNIELIEILAPLLEDPNEPIQDGLCSTPMGTAVKLGMVDVIKVLAPLLINPNAFFGPRCNWTPIYWAAYRGEIEVVKALIPWTENPNAPNLNGKTPLECAVAYGHTEIVELLRPFASLSQLFFSYLDMEYRALIAGGFAIGICVFICDVILAFR